MNKRFVRLASAQASPDAPPDGFMQHPTNGVSLPEGGQATFAPLIVGDPATESAAAAPALSVATPDVSQTVRLDTDTELSVLQDIRQLLQNQVEQGVVWAAKIVVIAGSTPAPKFRPPLFALSLINDGPSVLQYRIPDGRAVWDELNPGDAVAVEFQHAVIRQISFQVTSPGTQATVRLKGTY